MKKLFFSFLIAIMSLQLAGCNKEEPATTDADDEAVEDTEETMDDAEDTEDTEDSEQEREEGAIPFDYPTEVALNASEGDFVLAPSLSTLEDAFAENDDSPTMIFYSRVLKTIGDKESTLEEFGDEVSMPNSLIVPIPAGETAQPGDVVLTWWQSGSGMTRAIVVEGGSDREPMAQYLDLSFDYEPERLKLDSFHVLTEEMEPGTTVAVKDGGEYNHEIVLNVAGDKVLTSGFASVVAVRNKADLIAVPIVPEVEVGDEVYVPVIGTYRRGTVTGVDAANGKVTVEYEWAGSTSEEDFPFGDVAASL